MENKLRYFLTAFFGSLGLFVVIVFIYSLIRGRDEFKVFKDGVYRLLVDDAEKFWTFYFSISIPLLLKRVKGREDVSS